MINWCTVLKKMWPSTTKLYWDPWRDIPVIKPSQEEVELLYQIKLVEPGDARPAFKGDLLKLREAIVSEFGDDKLYSRFFETRFILLNKVPHWDIMYEVVASGNIMGQLYYDPYYSKWRFRLSFQGAYLALQENLVEVIRVNQPVYTGRVFKKNTSSRQVVIVDQKGIIRGIGENNGDAIEVVKTFHDRTLPVETSNKPTTLEDVIKYNLNGLDFMEEKSIAFLKKLRERYRDVTKAVVSYSGGKDSLVALDLVHKAFNDLEIIFNDTGLELPETLNNVEQVTKYYGYKLLVASAGDIFWRAVNFFGPPGKDYRWCCKVTKLVPIAKLTRTLYSSGALNIVGQRAYESFDRAKSPLVWRNKWIPHMVTTTPIQYWSQLAGWLYIHRYKLPYNKLYEEGFDRLGCYLCPSCTLAEFKEVERIYPEHWSRWLNILEEWRRKLNLPSEWIKLGLWRWLTPSTAKKRIVSRIPEYRVAWQNEYTLRLKENNVGLAPISIKTSGEHLEVVFNKQVLTSETREAIIRNLVNLEFKLVEENPLTLEKNNTLFKIQDNTIKLEGRVEESFEDLVDILKVIYRARGCVLCGSCVLWTPRGTVKLTQSGPILQGKLDEKQAVTYLNICPISDQFIEKITISLITSNYKSYTRKTRKKIKTSQF